MYTTIGTLFEQTVHKYPNKEALYYVQKNVRYSYKEWDQQIKCQWEDSKVSIEKGVR